MPSFLSSSRPQGPAAPIDTTVTRNAYTSTQKTPESPESPFPPRRTSSNWRRPSNGGPTYSPVHRGFQPLPMPPTPTLLDVQASFQHAWAARDEPEKKPFRLPQSTYNVDGPRDTPSKSSPRSTAARSDKQLPPSPLLPPTPTLNTPLTSATTVATVLRRSQSVAERVRGGLSTRSSSTYGDDDDDEGSSAGDFRSRSADQARKLANHTSDDSGGGHDSSLTDDTYSADAYDRDDDNESILSVEDVMDLYGGGFGSPRTSFSVNETYRRSLHSQYEQRRANRVSRMSRTIDTGKFVVVDDDPNAPRTPRTGGPVPFTLGTPNNNSAQTTFSVHVLADLAEPRDRYGFKKVSTHISEDRYNAWNADYTMHLIRRRRKWTAMMKSFGLATDKPFRFPPKSDKIKRYVRKGVPPEWRGAFWWWYSGGPGKLQEQAGLYQSLLEQVKNGKLPEHVRDLIERDLNRTFPDNVKFKPDQTATVDSLARPVVSEAGKRLSEPPETPTIRALRRVLQAFAVHNPAIGYCQSLNFIAGLLLLFLKNNEERAFVLLNIVTSQHLPGTHGAALEGANIDVAVLMSLVKEMMPTLWEKLDDGGGATLQRPAAQAFRLPTVSLATTAWFMSLFIGSLPIECVLRVWDCIFFEGSKTLFRIALAIFKAGERRILAVSDQTEMFQAVQQIPRQIIDANGLMNVCFRRQGGFGHISQTLIDQKRKEIKDGVVVQAQVQKSGFRDKFRLRSRSMMRDR